MQPAWILASHVTGYPGDMTDDRPQTTAHNPTESAGGDGDRGPGITVRLTALRSSAGDEIVIPRAGVTCIVGGNNVGKSQLLREIDGRLTSDQVNSVVLNELRIEKAQFDDARAAAFLEAVGVRTPSAPGVRPSYTAVNGGQQMTVQDFVAHYQSGPVQMIAARQFFVWYASAGSLLGLASGGIGAAGMGPPVHPLNRLF